MNAVGTECCGYGVGHSWIIDMNAVGTERVTHGLSGMAKFRFILF